ncbi:MAG: hypothetical protein M3352_07750 [Bacteroidota bacterium]|nr:hypothetical protein [Bacteroidota bacterium]
MSKLILLFTFIIIYSGSSAQKIEAIFFNLYTDSLKKGFYNYINIDGKASDGTWMPLDSTQIIFRANTGHFKGNDIFIDSSYTADTVKVKAILRANPAIWKETIIYIRKRGFDEPLKSNDEILNDIRNNSRKKKERSG